NEHGKPLVKGCSFNISWVENAMVLILGSADSALGIDLEHRKRFLSALGNHQKQERLRQTAREFCTTEEQAWLDEQEVRGGPEGWLLGFGRIWTRKESLIKAWGQSIGSHALLASLEGDLPPAIRWGNSDWLSREDCLGA